VLWGYSSPPFEVAHPVTVRSAYQTQTIPLWSPVTLKKNLESFKWSSNIVMYIIQVAGPLKLSYFIAVWAMIDFETPMGLKRDTTERQATM